MPRFYEPDLAIDPNSPFVRDALVNSSPRLLDDMTDQTLVTAMIREIGVNLTNDKKRAHLTDLRRKHLIDQVCPQELLPPER